MNIYFNNFVNNLHEENQLLKRYPHLCFEFIIHVRKNIYSKIENFRYKFVSRKINKSSFYI